MSDARLRELERAWRASGALEDEAALVALRLQAGELSRERLALAAHLGSLAAQRALNAAPAPAAEPATPSWWERVSGKAAEAAYWADEAEFEAWCDWIDEAGREPRTRVALAAASVAVAHERDPQIAPHWRDARAAVRAWLVDSEAVAACEEVRARMFLHVDPELTEELFGDNNEAMEEALLDGAPRSFVLAATLLDFALDRGPFECEASVHRLLDGLEQVVADGRAKIRTAIEAEVLPWALGHADPLAVS